MQTFKFHVLKFQNMYFVKCVFFNRWVVRLWRIVIALFSENINKKICKNIYIIRKDLCLKMDKSPYQSAVQYGRKWKKVVKLYLSLKIKFIPKRKLGNGKLWIYQLKKEPYFPYEKRAQIRKVSKLLLILILTHRQLFEYLFELGGRLKRQINYKRGVRPHVM